MTTFYVALAIFFGAVAGLSLAAARFTMNEAWRHSVPVRYLLLVLLAGPLLLVFLASTFAVLACTVAAYRAA